MPTDLSTMGPLPPAPHQRETRNEAARTAARWAKVRYRQILELLESRGGLCIFEIAAAITAQQQLTVHDHQISGRFGAMVHAGLIERAGIRRPTPTGHAAEVYQITLAGLAVLKDQPSAIARPADAPGEPANKPTPSAGWGPSTPGVSNAVRMEPESLAMGDQSTPL